MPYYHFSETGYAYNAVDDVQRQLEDYDGDNVWGEVILELDGYDEGTTRIVDRGQTGNAFVASDVVYQWRPDLLDGVWHASCYSPEEWAMTNKDTRRMARYGVDGRGDS